jgi:hypothetical protein
VLIDLARDETSPHRNVTFPSKNWIGFSHWNWEVVRQLIDDARHRRGVEKKSKSHKRQSCLPAAIATCYARTVNRNIFYIIGVIVVVIIVLKVLGLF